MFDYGIYNDITKDEYLLLYRKMLVIRMVSEALRQSSLRLELKCPVHFSIGQEATAAGLCANLLQGDYMTTTHRSHAPYLAKGCSVNKMIAEIFNKKTGCVGGIGGSMHLSSPENNLYSSAICGSGLPIAVGMGLALKFQHSDNLAVAFFGDGATEQGVFHESLNFASLKKLPIIFFCENNFYSVHAHISHTKSNHEIYKMAGAYNMPSYKIDGNNILEVYSVTKDLVEYVRSKNGPVFIEAVTYRWLEHVGPNFDHLNGYRLAEEVERWIAKCPIKHYQDYLLGINLLDNDRINEIRKSINDDINASWEYMRMSPYPALEEIL